MAQVKIVEGGLYKTNRHSDVKILSYKDCKNVLVEFQDSGSVVTTCAYSLRRGSVFDPYDPYILGVGYYGDTYNDKSLPLKTLAFKRWNLILHRCYETKNTHFHNYGKRGVKVCKSWHNFSNFYRWFVNNYKKGMQIDSDLFSEGIKEYSPEKCVFVPRKVNSLLVTMRSIKRDLPIGVYKHKVNKNYVASLSVDDGKVLKIGSYKTPEEAFDAYAKHKKSRINAVAEECLASGEISLRIYQALIDYEILPFPDLDLVESPLTRT